MASWRCRLPTRTPPDLVLLDIYDPENVIIPYSNWQGPVWINANFLRIIDWIEELRF